jgi:gluconate 2-dehydrogenase gamma chain
MTTTATGPNGESPGFFNKQQRQIVAAAMARIIPSDHHAGATEAGTIDFLDRYLSGISHVYAKPDGSGFETLEGKRATAWQQRIAAIRERYLAGIAEIERVSQQTFGQSFVALQEPEQDRVLATIENPARAAEREAEAANAVAGFAPPEPGLQQMTSEMDLTFFPMLVLHTRQGFLSDPVYGGNRNHCGWAAIGFPGPASMAEVHAGNYSTLSYFAEPSPAPWEGSGQGTGGDAR